MSAALIPHLENFEDEPRIRDIDLAVALGYSRPADIRELISRHRGQLEEFGIIRTVRINTGERGRPAQEYWLTERQAYLVCTYAETPKADEVRLALVEAFFQFRHGVIVPAQENRETRMLTMQKLEVTELLKPFESRLFQIEGKVDSLHDKSDQILSKLDEVVDDCRHRRKDIFKTDRLKHQDCLWIRRRGICPCCQEEEIVRSGVKTEKLTFDHWYSRNQSGLKETWPVCRDCNQKLRTPGFKKSRQSAFTEYQYVLEAHMCPLFRNARIS